MSPAGCLASLLRSGMCTLVKCTCLPVMYARVGCSDLPVLCAAWLRWGHAAPHTCHARYVRLSQRVHQLYCLAGEGRRRPGRLVGCMQKTPPITCDGGAECGAWRTVWRLVPRMLSPASPWGGGFRHAIIPRANRAGGRGSFWCYQTRASDSKWSGNMVRNFVPSLRGQKCHT